MIIAGIPAYNEEKTIARVILLAQKHVDMIIVCDDGSTDLTGDIAKKLGATVIQHKRNRGYGAAVKTLFKRAKEMNADILLTLDADGQHNGNEIPSLIQLIAEEKADVVIGSRFMNSDNNVPSYRRFGIKLLTKLSNGRTPELSDAQSGFRAYNRKAIQELKPIENGMGISAEILMKVREKGLRVAEVPAAIEYKGLETSTQNPLRHGLSVLSTIIRLVVEERPLFYLGLPGAAFLCVGTVFFLWTLQLFSIEGRIITNVALASLAFTIIGMFTLFTAITLYAILRLSQKQHQEEP